MLYGRKFSTFKMGMQVSHRVQSEVSQEDHLQPVTCGYTTIREQEKQDMLEDKLTTKEYNDPFKGSR